MTIGFKYVNGFLKAFGFHIDKIQYVQFLREKVERQGGQIELLKLRNKCLEGMVEPSSFNSLDSMNYWYSFHCKEESHDLIKAQLFLNFFLSHGVLTCESKVLDVGCGLGSLAGMIKRMFPNCLISGCDFSPIAVTHAKAQYPEVDFFVHDIYEVFIDKYDIVFCTEVLEHLKKPNIALKNLFGSLNNRGVLLVTVPNGASDTSSHHVNHWGEKDWQHFVEHNSNGMVNVEIGTICNSLTKVCEFNSAIFKGKDE